MQGTFLEFADAHSYCIHPCKEGATALEFSTLINCHPDDTDGSAAALFTTRDLSQTVIGVTGGGDLINNLALQARWMSLSVYAFDF